MKKLVYLFLIMLITVPATAQVTTSSMSGRVTDGSNAVLPGATVIAVHVPSGTQYGTVADVNGNYRIMNMRPGGPYTVTVQMLGFLTNEFNGIELALGDNYILDSHLTETAIGMESVVVTAVGNNNMNTDRAGAMTSVNARGISLTPTISRSINDIARYSPQSTTTSNGLAVGGGNYRSSYVTVDGAAFNNAFGIGENLPSGGSPISLDALDQITVSITPYDVRQSGFTGGAINAVTRSGDNEFRASVYTYLNNENFKGYKIRDDIKFDKDEQKTNTFGMRFGGPIIKNKLFFFVNAEYEKQISPGPSARARNNSSADWGSNNVNRPTVDQMNNIQNYLRQEYGYDPGGYQGYSLDAPSWKVLARVDWNIHENHKLNVRYSTTRNKYSAGPSGSNPILSNNAYPNGGSRTANTAMYFYNTRYWQERNFTSFAGELNSVFGNEINNTFRVTYSHQHEPRSWDGGTFPTVDILSSDGTSGNLPFTTFGLDPYTYGNLRDVKTFLVTNEVTFTRRINNVTVGAQYEFDRTKNGYMQGGAGYYVYRSWDDFVNKAIPYSFAITHSNRADLKQVYPSFDYHQFSIYAQDKLDISDRFKLTLGLRIEIPIFPSLENNFNPEFATLDFDGKSYSTDQMPKARVQFSPRVGFNWDLRGDRVHVLRGGAGIFTGRLPFVWIVSTVGDSGVQQTLYSVANADENSKVPGFHSNVNDILNDLYGGNYTPGDPIAPTAPTIMDKDLKMPQTLKVSLAYDVRLPGGILGTIEGIYNRNINQVVVTNIGLKDPTPNGLTLSENDVRDYYGNGYWAKNSNGANVTPYLLENGGKAGWYYSLTAKLEKNFHFGLTAMAAYTYSDSRSTNDGIGDRVASAWNTNSSSINGVNDHTLGFSSYVSPHRLIVSLGFRKGNTSVGLFYEGSNLGYFQTDSYTYTRYSYTYTTNVVGDRGGNNLLYVPKDWDELNAMTFVDYDGYTAEQQKADFWLFVNQDKYLKKRKGKYAQRNGAVMPWRSRFDLKYMRDFNFNVGGKVNTIQVGLDIINVANLINRNWGNVKKVDNTRPLAVVDIKDSQGTVTGKGFQYQKNGSEVLRKTYSPAARYASTYSMQVSFRYIFN